MASYTEDQLAAVVEAVEQYGSINKAAEVLGLARSTAQTRFKVAKGQGAFDFVETKEDKALPSPEDLISSEIPLSTLIDRSVTDSRRRIAAQRQRRSGINISVPSTPYALVLMGDPHVDDPGCDLAQLFTDADTVRETDNMFAVPAGDYQNLWIGRLARIYADQTVTAKDSWRLVKHLLVDRITPKKLKAVMLGNHDLWAGNNDLLQWMLKDEAVYFEKYDLKLHFRPSAGRTMKLWMRHDFAGRSMWHNVHGLLKAAKGDIDAHHVYAAGDKHCFGYLSEFRPNGDMFHAVRSRGYKMIDSYADSLGFNEPESCPSPTIIVDPKATDPKCFVRVEFSVQQAADYLNFLNKRS